MMRPSRAYSVEVSNRFSVLNVADDEIESHWEKLTVAISAAASTVIGVRPNIRQPWMSAATYDGLLQKAVARDHGLVGERRRLQGVFNAKSKADRESYYNKLADEAEEGLRHNSLRPAFRTIRRLGGKKENLIPSPINKADGSKCSSTDELLQRWLEHFETALNFPPADPCSELE